MATKITRGFVWIRRDIRLHDHPALSHALEACSEVHVGFIFDDTILAPLKTRPPLGIDRRVQFIAESLAECDTQLRQYGSRLHIRYGNPSLEIPELVRALNIDRVYFNRDYSPYAVSRDTDMTEQLESMGASVHSFRDHVIFEPEEILNNAKKPYGVFTPYSKAWRDRLSISEDRLTPFSVKWSRLAKSFDAPPLKVGFLLELAGFEHIKNDLKGGSAAGLLRLNQFTEKMQHYDQARDFFGEEGTSKLSVYLRHGCISIRDMVNVALSYPSLGAEKWLSELIWREFYQMIFHFHPWVNDRPYQNKFQDMQWPTSEAYFEAFKNGHTGFPIIDAAMRCLNQTGWMPNRLRMVTASFLTKILLVDWKRGERYFSWKLLDYELQSNNGGWQWAAGIGCDAAPYFRIFNPITQSKTYDTEGGFIRQYCPELSVLSHAQIHFPAGEKQLPLSFQLGVHYPMPIVDYASQRIKALELFSHASASALVPKN